MPQLWREERDDDGEPSSQSELAHAKALVWGLRGGGTDQELEGAVTRRVVVNGLENQAEAQSRESVLMLRLQGETVISI